MPKNKRPPPHKNRAVSQDQEEALTQKLCGLAVELAEQEEGATMTDALRKTDGDLNKLIKKTLFQKKDAVLYAALDRARYTDIDAYLLLKERIEEASGVIVTGREVGKSDGKNVEVNAFIIPMFVQKVGGLDYQPSFNDQEAFDLLTASFQQAQLESRDATVVLVNHAYHPDEIEGISFCHLNEMVWDAHASMTDKKARATTPAIDRSFSGGAENHFAPDDPAVELRFLLGFAMKATDDPFYRIPDDDAAVDAYFDARAGRFERWTEQVAPIVKRCLVGGDTEVHIDFLYQDLFHGGKERGIAEYCMLQMLSELNRSLQALAIDGASTNAIVGPVDREDETVLRVNLYASADGALLASSEKPWSISRDFQFEIVDIRDALKTIGVTSLAVAETFDDDGQAVDARPYQ
ncbi:MAG: DUF2863 family protein [Burkholderiales bacterium]